MATTKSGIETPTDPPKESLAAPTKIYPASSKLASQAGKSNGTVCGPAETAYKGHGRK